MFPRVYYYKYQSDSESDWSNAWYGFQSFVHSIISIVGKIHTFQHPKYFPTNLVSSSSFNARTMHLTYIRMRIIYARKLICNNTHIKTAGSSDQSDVWYGTRKFFVLASRKNWIGFESDSSVTMLFYVLHANVRIENSWFDEVYNSSDLPTNLLS
jgi:hypothetical protein